MPPRSSPSTTRRGLLGLCAAGATGLAGCGAVGRECPSPSVPDSSDDWAHRFHDVGNTNAAPDGPDALQEQWTVRVGTRLTRPLVADGTVYTTALPEERPYRSQVLAVDAGTGEGRWEAPFGAESHDGYVAAAVDGTVYVVLEPIDFDGWRLLALDADDGTERWRFDVPGRVNAVLAAGGAVYVSVLHGSVVALDAADGRPCARRHPGDGPFDRWLSSLTPVGRPAFAAGAVFTPAARFDADREEDDYFDDRVVALDADGGERWSHPLDGVVWVEDLAATDDAVFVPVTDRRSRPETSGAASLHALETASGERRWRRSFEAGSLSAVAVAGDALVFSGDGVRALDPATGETRWRSERFFGSPTAAGDRVYCRRTEGEFVDTVVAADLETGEPAAAHTFDYQVNRPPVFADGRAFVVTLEFDHSGDRIEHVADRIHALW